MENLAYDVKQIIQEKLFLYEELKNVLEQERKHIGDMNLAALWGMTDKKNQIAEIIKQKREQIFQMVQKQKTVRTLELKSFSLTEVIDLLPCPASEKSDLKKVKVQLDIIKDELVGMAFENKKHAKEHLDVVNGVIETILDSENLSKYSKQGRELKDKSGNFFLRAEV